MSGGVEIARRPAARWRDHGGSFLAAELARRFALLTGMVVLSLVLRALITTNADVSWLITANEWILAGKRPYVDFIEVNPPACFLLYILPVIVARAVGLAPEFVVGAFTFAGIAASMIVSGRIAGRAGLLERANAPALAAWTFAALAILPMRTFAEREHIAVIAILPILAVLAARARGTLPTLTLRIVAGLGAGVTIAIKPHFAVAVGLAIIAAAVARKSWRQLFALENWVAGTVAVAYAAYFVLVYPEFLRDLLPLLQAVYLPIQMPLWKLLIRPGFLGWIAALRLIALWQPGALRAAPVSILVAASAGFAFCYLFQGKGWPYHSYPMVALGLIALAAVMVTRGESPARPADARVSPLAFRLILIAVIGFSCAWNNVHRSMDAVIAPISRIAPKPSMVVIGSDFAISHPLVRQLGGTWASRVGSLWISAGAFQMLVDGNPDPAAFERLRDYARFDRDMLVEDIDRNRPDIILVLRATFDWLKWAQADRLLSERLKDYDQADSVEVAKGETFVIFKRRAP